jgi:hypothetical protein
MLEHYVALLQRVDARLERQLGPMVDMARDQDDLDRPVSTRPPDLSISTPRAIRPRFLAAVGNRLDGASYG